MKTLVIADLHNKIKWVKPFIEENPADEIVLLGDIFDSINDDYHDAGKTAYYFLELLQFPNLKVTLGNHDIPYRFPLNRHLYCPGFDRKKWEAVNSVLKEEHWAKTQLCYFTQNFLLSHAGVNESLFTHPIHGLSVVGIETYCKEALERADLNCYVPQLAWGKDRGGKADIGGITWLDWNSFEPIFGLNQIVGHTPDDFVRQNYIFGSENYCLDTHGKYVGWIEDGKFSYQLRPINT